MKIMLSLLMAAVLGCPAGPAWAQMTRQEHIHRMSHNVMPFDMSKTLHIFKMTEQGGIERVVVREGGGNDQVVLIRRHLQHEAVMFKKGDYSDPEKLHGKKMPGLGELKKRASQIKVSYTALENGAEITFETRDIHLLTEIHRWFGAQLSEHGPDAKAE